MKIIRATTRKTGIQPAARFTGTVYSDPIVDDPAAPSRVRAGKVTFAPGGRTAWHTHPVGQILHVLHGTGRYQAEGGPVLVLQAGDTVNIPPDIRHWHGAAPDSQMAHLALSENAPDGSSTNWQEHVTDADYLKPARIPGPGEENGELMVRRGSVVPTRRQPEANFTGTVFSDPISEPVGASRMRAGKVTFTPGARTAWHTHPIIQILWMFHGIGRLQAEGGPVLILQPGDTAIIPAGLRHWHGAAPDSLFAHLSLTEQDENGSNATWQEHVSDEDYGKAAQLPE